MKNRAETVLRIWLAVQLAASIVANELGAADSFEARLIAPVAPLILFGSIESLLWIPVRRDFVGMCRAAVTVGIGAGAAVLSFDTIGHLGAQAGLGPAEQTILALIIDGGILAVGLSLLSLRTQHTEPESAEPVEPVPIPVEPDPPDERTTEPEPVILPETEPTPEPVKVPDTDTTAPSVDEHNLPTAVRRQRVWAASAVGDVDLQLLADRFGCSVRTIQRDLEQREQVSA